MFIFENYFDGKIYMGALIKNKNMEDLESKIKDVVSDRDKLLLSILLPTFNVDILILGTIIFCLSITSNPIFFFY